MSEISIKIKGPITKVRNAKKKAKARTTKPKPKTKTEAYLEKLKGREYSYNTSPFYDYKSSLQPTYIYKQQTIPQLQQDSKHNELIKYLEDIKKNDRESQTGKFRHTEHLLNEPKPKTKEDEEEEDEETKTTSFTKVDEVVDVKDVMKLRKLEKEIEDIEEKIKPEKTKYNKAIDREIKGLKYEGYPSSLYQERIDILKKEIAVKELEKNILKRNLGIK